MNIVEAMTKFNKQNIIIISGLAGTHKSKLGKFFSKLFKFNFVNLSKFFFSPDVFDKPENYVELSDGSSVLAWDDIYKSIDWDKFNAAVKKVAPSGVVVVGMGFPASKIDFKPDIHIHLKIAKEKLLENIHEYLENHPNNPNAKIKGKNVEELIFNKVTFPNYLRARNEATINRFINITEMTEVALRKDIFEYVKMLINKWLTTNKANASKSNKYTHEENDESSSSLDMSD